MDHEQSNRSVNKMAVGNNSASHPFGVVLLRPNKDCKADDDIPFKDSLIIFANH
jgi:hypothetical protein